MLQGNKNKNDQYHISEMTQLLICHLIIYVKSFRDDSTINLSPYNICKKCQRDL
jgi:hypothetical protein